MDATPSCGALDAPAVAAAARTGAASTRSCASTPRRCATSGASSATARALDLVEAADGSAERLATLLARGMRFFDDRGFYKRAQIVPSDLALAGAASFDDLDRLTIFADNLVPHVLRVDGVLRYDPELAARIDAGELLPQGRAEQEIRACALHACEQLAARTGIAAARARHPALEPRPRARVQGGAAAPHAHASTTSAALAAGRVRPAPALQARDLGALGLAAGLLRHQLLELGRGGWPGR